MELHDLYRELAARLDNKIIILQELLAQCDQSSERLEMLVNSMDVDATSQPATAEVDAN